MSNPDFFCPGKGRLGAIFGNINRNRTALGFSIVNDLVFTFSRDADPKDLKQRILERVKKLNIEKITPREEHFSYKYMQIQLDSFKIYIPTLIIIMGLLSLTTTFIIYNRFIISQRKEIGTLLCLGHSKREVIKSYVYAAMLLGSLSSVLGLAISLLTRNSFASTQAKSLDLPVLYTNIYFISLLKGALFGITITVIAPLLLLPRLLRLSPHEIIRETVKQGTLQNTIILPFFRRLSFLSSEVRYAMRNIIRHKWLSISTITCIGLSLGISISYIITTTSIKKTVVERAKNEQWDLAVDFFYPMYIDELRPVNETPGVTHCEPYIRKSAEVMWLNRCKDSRVLGVNPESAMRRVSLRDGVWLREARGREIILNQDIADALGVGVNEEVKLKVNQKYFPLKVVGISSDYLLGQSVIPLATAQEIFECSDEATGVFLATAPRTSSAAIKSALQQFDFVGRVTDKMSNNKEALDILTELMGTVYLSAIFSIIISLIYIYTNVNLTIFERKAEFAILRSLGYGKKSIRKIILSQVLISGFFGGIVCIPVAVVTSKILNQQLSKAWYQVQNHYALFDFAGFILLAMIFMPLVALPAIKFIQNFDIGEILYQRNIE
ncbi:MAG: FtsX-like permease family protein [bacterium]